MKKNRGAHPQFRTSAAHAGKLQAVDELIASARYADARERLESLLLQEGRNPLLLHKLGVVLIHLKDVQLALQVLDEATRLSPHNSMLRNDLGIALEKAGKLEAAESAYREAVRLDPRLAEGHANLADLLIKLERPDQAIFHAEKCLQLSPGNPLSWLALGEGRFMQGKFGEAIAAFEKAVKARPPQVKAFTELARVYAVRNRKDEAFVVLREARKLFGNDPRILNDLGLALGSLKRYDDAQELFETAYQKLREPTTLFNVLTNLAFQKKFEEMFAWADEALALPQPNIALSPLFSQASATCQWHLQERLLPRFLEWINSDDNKMATTVGQSLLLLLPIASVSPQTVRNMSEKAAATYRGHIRHWQLNVGHDQAMQPSPKLRIGYLSGDFRTHVVNYFISGQLSHYDKQYFEVYCYSSLDPSDEDGVTEQYRCAVDSFVRVSDMDNEALTRRIAADGIHLLIDLSGYTSGSRMAVMFHRPAPVQFAYLGYPFTTGVEEIDYVFSDPWLDGPDNAAAFTEEILRIPHCFISSGDLPVTPQDIEPPMFRNGFVTFGSLNNCYKLNPQTVAAWSRILSMVPDARLVLNNPRYDAAITRDNVLREFEHNGIARERIDIVRHGHPKGRHLYWYEDIDIALDSFPQTGGTTTTEALWMGVPVVTLVGPLQYQRLSYSVLKNCDVEIDDLVAFDVDDYVSRAVSLAGDKARIAQLHSALRRSVRHSLIFDPARQVRYFEETLIDGWNRHFPALPKFSPETFQYAQLNTPCAPWVATVPDPENLFRYVIEEQGRWFAPEYGELGKLAQILAGSAVEIGSEPGFFSLELAHAGMRTLALCTSAVAARQIQAAAEKGDVAARVQVRLESARSDLLDRAEVPDVVLLRIGVEANDGAAGPIMKNPDFWETNSPVVLVSLHSRDRADFSTAEKLATMGYRLYRLMPGFGCFVPHAPSEALDPYLLNLLACPKRHEAALTAAGILVPDAMTVTTTSLMPEDQEQAADPYRQIDDQVVRLASLAHDSEKEIAERLGYHQAALQAQLALVRQAPSTTRLITLARLLADEGRRAEASGLLHKALGEFENGSGRMTLPFLAPSAVWDEIPAGDRLAEWLFAALLETRCRLAAHSTHFLTDAELAPLEAIPTLGFSTDFLSGIRRARQRRH